MRTIFSQPPRLTRVLFLPKRPGLDRKLAQTKGPLVWDAGLPGPVPKGAYVVAGGESSKRWDELGRLLTWLAGARVERGQNLTVVGGGATLDLAALAASLYRRGIPVTLVPSTLLSMVDATLGGKTAVDGYVDGRLLKNFAGTFHPAKEIWACPELLATLPMRERVSGAGEVYKTMWIRGRTWDQKSLVEFVRDGVVSAKLTKIVRECLIVKAKLVERDPLDEKRVRELLNFGHTAGHALESAAGGRLAHGESVLWGMAVETSLFGARGKAQARACAAAIAALGLRPPAEFGRVSESEWVALLGADKKAKGGLLEMSLLMAPGKVVKKRYRPAEVARALREFGAR